jgi:plastocyanin
MLNHSRALTALVTAFMFAFVPFANAQPKKKPAPATQDDIVRLEKKLEDQQKVIDKLIKLQQQIMTATASALDANVSASAEPQPPTPPQPKPATPADTMKAVDAQPAVTVVQPTRHERIKPVAKAEKADKATFGTVVGKIANGGDAIVYVETVNAPVKGATASMKQEGKAFLPSTLVVTKGTKVEFPNRDAIFHNVFSVTPDISFDLGSYRQGESKSVTMSKPGVVTVYCNMHPQMVGHILVVPNGNYVRAGKDGFFRLTNVPTGQHRIVAWVPNSKAVSVAANVVENEVATVEMTLSRGKAATHTKKDGLPYGSYDK